MEGVIQRQRRRHSGGQEPHLYETEFVNTLGRRFPVEVSSSPIVKNGQSAGVLLVARDITERKQAEAELRESESRYRSMFENNHAINLIVDPESGAIIDANPAACNYYGWSRETLKTMKIFDINTLNKEEVHAGMQSSRTENRNYFMFQHRRADGTIRDVEVYSGPIQLKGRQFLFSVIHDISKRRQAEERIRHLNRVLHAIRDINHLIVEEKDAQSG